MSVPATTLFLCPQCRRSLPARPPCSCGFVLRESHGILNLLTDAEWAENREFVEMYERVRQDEGWGGNDLDLPFGATRHLDIWAIRQRTFTKLKSLLAGMTRGIAVDAGAGNCWLTRHLDAWGFDAIALDIFTGGGDGLAAGQRFIDEGAKFLRVRASMERLPFASGHIRLIAANASFHYVRDFRSTLSEFERVLTPGGVIAIVDSPFYETAGAGDRIMAERAAVFQRKFGMSEAMARRSRYLTFADLEAIARSVGLTPRVETVWPGLARSVERLRARLLGRQIAQFPVVLLEKR